MHKTTSVLAQKIAEKLKNTKKKKWTTKEKEEIFRARFPELPEHSDLKKLQDQLQKVKPSVKMPEEKSLREFLERRCRVCGSFLRASDKKFCWHCRTPIQG